MEKLLAITSNDQKGKDKERDREETRLPFKLLTNTVKVDRIGSCGSSGGRTCCSQMSLWMMMLLLLMLLLMVIPLLTFQGYNSWIIWIVERIPRRFEE